MSAKKALVVAIDDYGGTGANNLPSCINDAKAFTNQVLRQMFAFGTTDIHTLYDGDATLKNVEAELDWLTDAVDSDDRLVFYFSGHGFTGLSNGIMEEYLVLRDAAGPILYEDNHFVAKVKDLPEGIFTAILDMCFSGGAFKALTFDPVTGVARFEPTLVKALPFPPEREQQKAITLQNTVPVAYKRFGCSKTDRPSALAKIFAPDGARFLGMPKSIALSDPSEAPQPEMSGLLISACLETETASASNSHTRGLSAFTFAMLEALKNPTAPRTAAGVFDASAAILRSLGFVQTPMILERAVPGNLKNRAFITAEDLHAVPVTTEPIDDEKLFGAVLGRLAQAIPHVAPLVFEAILGQTKSSSPEAGLVDQISDDADEKFIGALLGTIAQVLPRVVPAVRSAIRARRKELALQGITDEAAQETEEKILGAILATVSQCIPHIAPMILEAVSGRRKAIDDGIAAAGMDEKSLRSVLRAVSRVIPQVAPIIFNAVAGRRKELGLLPADGIAGNLQSDEKFIGAVLGTLAQIIPHVAPIVVDAIAGRRKSLGGIASADSLADFEADDKLLGALYRTMVNVIPFVVPRLVDAVTGRPKALEGAITSGDSLGTEADTKFLGAVLGTLAQVIPQVAPMIVDTILSRRKEWETEEVGGPFAPTRETDEKFLGLAIGALASVIPHVAPMVVNAITSRRKELEESAMLGGVASGPAGDEKFLRDLIRHVRQVLPTVVTMVPAVLDAVTGPRKDLALELPDAAVTLAEADDKFLGAVMSALGRVLPAVVPAVVDALSGRRKQLDGLQPVNGAGGEAVDEKVFGAVMSALGQILPVVVPTILNSVGGRRKELDLTAGTDEKFLRALLPPLGPMPRELQAALARLREREVEQMVRCT
jgi:hypothetical protein